MKGLQQNQLRRLFDRTLPGSSVAIAQWECFAALLFWLGRVHSLPGIPVPPPVEDSPPLLASFFSFGSNSWGVTDAGNDQGYGYLQADSHNPISMGHTVRFYARQGVLRGGGVMWEGCGPFLFNGAFTQNVAWATMTFRADDLDELVFEATRTAGGYTYRDYYQSSSGPEKSITRQDLVIYYWDFPAQQLRSVVKPVYRLDVSTTALGTFSPGTVALWAAVPDNDNWDSKPSPFQIRAVRHATLDPGLPEDPRLDMPRTLYRMLTAPTADTLLSTAFQRYPLGWPLNFMVGSGKLGGASPQQLVIVTEGRVPFRKNEYVSSKENWSLDYQGPIVVQQLPERKWIADAQLARMYHPWGHFPKAVGHDPQRPVLYMANCNSSPQWIFGRDYPFPTWDQEENPPVWKVDPGYAMPPRSQNPYQQNPIVQSDNQYWNYLTKDPQNGGYPPSITVSYFQASPAYMFGVHTFRQEWVVNRLRDYYEQKSPTSAITEGNLKELINHSWDGIAYYLGRLPVQVQPTTITWFQSAKAYLQGKGLTNEAALMQSFDDWSTNHNADLKYSPSVTPVKWVIFWHRFRTDSALASLNVFGTPNRYFWPKPDENGNALEQAVAQALKEAAQYTVANTGTIQPVYTVNQLLRVRVPFVDGAEYGTYAWWGAIKRSRFVGWLTPPGPNEANPRMEVILESRLPLLVRFAKANDPNDRRVWVMNYSIVSDQTNLPEWQGSQYWHRYLNAIKNAAEGKLVSLPLTEAALQQLNPPAYSWTVTNAPVLGGKKR